MTEAAESQGQENVSQSNDSTPNVGGQGFAIPEAYQDRGWAQKITSMDDLFKSYDNAQSMIGKRTVPSSNAGDEEWQEFYKTLGVPDAPDQYELNSEFEDVPDGFPVDDLRARAAELAHKAGLTPKQASDLWNNYMGLEVEAMKKMETQNADRQAQLDKEFDELSSSMFGDSFKEKAAQAEQFLNNVLPEELKGVVDTIRDNPKAMLAMIKLADHSQSEIADVKRKYGAEDKLQSGGQSAAISQSDVMKNLIEAKSKLADVAPFNSAERAQLESEVERWRKLLK